MSMLAPYTAYDTRPRILSLNGGGDVIEWLGSGGILFKPRASHGLSFQELEVGQESFFDLVPPTLYGLLDDLVPGSDLSEKFLVEWQKFQDESGEPERLGYGVWVFYPRKKHLVRFAPTFWNRLALLVRNATLIQDLEMKIGWRGIREIFEKSVIAVAGCSVGNNVAHALIMDLRPLRIKVADNRDYHIPNGNRVRLTYEDFGRNKAIVTAEQIHAVDPHIGISVFTEGVHEGNVDHFIAGDAARQEPAATLLVEETDDPDVKILIREKARYFKIPVVMVTDIGSAVQVDIRRFDLDNTIALAACGVSDEELYGRRDRWRADLASRSKFFDFAFALVGTNHVLVPELDQILSRRGPILFAGVPQLGSTAMMAGGVAAEIVARLLLGFRLPERMFINKYTGEVLKQGGSQ